MTVQLANDKTLTLMGEVAVTLQLGGKQVRHKFKVADISNDVLLGLDFLRSRDCLIDVSNQSLV